MYDASEQLGPIDWWVWHRRNLSLLVTITAVTRSRAMLEGVTKIKGANGVWDVDAEVVREGETRQKRLAMRAA